MFSQLQVFVPQCGHVRGMATLKTIRMRLKSVKNIQKITKSMKMVSAAKYSKAERELKAARPFGVGAQAFYEKAEVQPDEGKEKKLVVAISSDRGLCGAIHSSVSKTIRSMLATGDRTNTKLIFVGDKVRQQLYRMFGQNVVMHFTDVGKKPPTFVDATYIAQNILNSGYEFDHGIILYNHFRSVVSYKTTQLPIYSLDVVNNAKKISLYDSLDADVLQSFQEFNLASLIFYTLKENSTSEQSSRMTAMDSASKNAGEMIDKLTLTFNRTRQAVITRELIEIISGASAL